MYCWRTQAASWVARAYGIVLTSGAGALGVRLGGPLQMVGSLQFRPEIGIGADPDVDDMQAAVGLIWRALVLWMFVVLLVTVARSFG